jgi:hypothetical protein
MTPLALLAPDQRAVLELVLRQDRSYGELSELLEIPEREVRARAEAALHALAGEPGDERVDTGRITDWLLGQQNERAAAATAERVTGDETSRAWAARAAERLREVGGERVPSVGGPVPAPPRPRPAPDDPAPAAPRPRPARDAPSPSSSPRPGPLRDAAAQAARPATPHAGDAPRVSRLGGAILIAVVALALVAVLVWPINLLGLGGASDPAPATAVAPTPTPSSTSIAAQATGNDVVLRGVGGSKAEGLMRLFKAQDGTVQYAIGAQGVPNNAQNDSYAVWFTGAKDAKPRLLGFPQTAVTNGTLTVGGPGKSDVAKFPIWFATYRKVLITRETNAKPTRPGAAVLEGTLPAGQAN